MHICVTERAWVRMWDIRSVWGFLPHLKSMNNPLCLWELFPLEKYHSIPIYEIELCLNKGSGVLTSITNIKKVRYWTWGDDSESFHPRRLTRQFNLLYFFQKFQNRRYARNIRLDIFYLYAKTVPNKKLQVYGCCAAKKVIKILWKKKEWYGPNSLLIWVVSQTECITYVHITTS